MASRALKEKKGRTIQCILQAATNVFSEVGFAGARVDEIADRAGVNKATIYYHIGDKEALYAQVIHNIFGKASEIFARNLQTATSPEEKLCIFVRNVAQVVDQHPELAAIILREQASGGQNLPEMVAQDLARIIGIISEILEEGAQKGVFTTTIPVIVHLMIIGSIVFLKMSAPIRSKHNVLSQITDQLDHNVSGPVAEEIEKLILNGVKKR